MGKVLDHGAVPHPQRLLPYGVAGDVVPSLPFVQRDDFPRQIHQGILAAVTGRDISAMNSRQPARQGQPVQFRYHKAVMDKELIVVGAIAYVALVGAVNVEAGERWRVDRKVDGFTGESLHDFDAVSVVDGVAVGDDIHEGITMGWDR